MTNLAPLLVNNGYAASAAEAVASAKIAETASLARERITAIVHNYYMQYLALQLSRYKFDLNRPRIAPAELIKAEALIKGVLGNEPLDNPRLANILESVISDILAQHNANPMLWEELYNYRYQTDEGVVIRGADIVKALLRSNSLHYGTKADMYIHHYNDTEYRTISMHHVMARVLSTLRVAVKGVNSYGIAIEKEDVERLRNLATRLTAVRDSQSRSLFQQNGHHQVKENLKLLFRELLSPSTDLFSVYTLNSKLVQDNFNPSMYNNEWRGLLNEMQEGLEWIATPYARVNHHHAVH
ncbi:MAG: hypothetical protein J0M34_01395 [Alphaproteobacteria bacterium]|nr:hypothetical protein [Alphaproteobacteria bacterium]